jgi:hypothetical protein
MPYKEALDILNKNSDSSNIKVRLLKEMWKNLLQLDLLE